MEVHPQYAQIARDNIVKNNVGHRLSIIHGNINARPIAFDSCTGIMTNPPYENDKTAFYSVDELKNIANIESTVSLDEWITYCLAFLKCRGYFAIIYKMERLDNIIASLYKKAGDMYILPIQTQYNTAPKRVFVLARKGIKTGVKMCPPLHLRNENGELTFQAQQILSGHQSYDIFTNSLRDC